MCSCLVTQKVCGCSNYEARAVALYSTTKMCVSNLIVRLKVSFIYPILFLPNKDDSGETFKKVFGFVFFDPWIVAVPVVSPSSVCTFAILFIPVCVSPIFLLSDFLLISRDFNGQKTTKPYFLEKFLFPWYLGGKYHKWDFLVAFEKKSLECKYLCSSYFLFKSHAWDNTLSRFVVQNAPTNEN